MPLRKLQNWLLFATLLLALIVGMSYKATQAIRQDLAAAESLTAIRKAYTDTLITAYSNVDRALAKAIKLNSNRITKLERAVKVDTLATNRKFYQVDRAMEAQARAIRHRQ